MKAAQPLIDRQAFKSSQVANGFRMLGSRFDYSLKIVVVGDSGVGKTCFLLRFVRDQWEGDTTPTLGVEFLAKIVTTENHHIQLQLWDTAGQELFRSVTRGYYRGSAGALILFDLTSPDSFASVKGWLKDLREVARTDVVVVLIGNKSDLVEERQITKDVAQAFADRNTMLYFETSARTGDNIPNAVTQCVLQIEKKVDDGLFDVTPHPEPTAFNPMSKTGSNCPC
jgi:small GTP-binding protein